MGATKYMKKNGMSIITKVCKSTRIFGIVIFCCICTCACATEKAVSNSKDNGEMSYKIMEADAVTGNEVNEKFVRLSGNVTSEMLNADYWLAGDNSSSTEVLLTNKDIQTFNDKNNKMITTKSGVAFAVQDIEEVFDGEIVRELVNTYQFPEGLSKAYVNGKETDKAYWANLVSNLNVEAIRDEVQVKYGFSVQRANVRIFATNDFYSEGADDLLYDDFARGECMPYEPVAIFHESADGQWYYAALYGYAGWIEKKYVAVCDTKEEWLERQKMEDVLVVTGREIRLNENPYSNAVSGLLLPMGTTLKLISAEEAPESFDKRTSYYNYIVQVPVRLENGKITDEYALIPISDDVHVGYLPYTRENVLNLAFKLLGDRYGWAGMYYANDCSGIVHEIFSCFGIKMPRSAKAQILIPDFKNIDVSGKSDKKKLSVLEDVPAGSLIYFPGHIMIYLGMKEEIPYVISSVGSFCTVESGAENPISVNSVVVNDMINTIRGSGASWLSATSAIVVYEFD